MKSNVICLGYLWHKKKSERGHHRTYEELTFKEGFSTTRSHLLCSPGQGPLHSLIILKLEYLGGVFGEILIWIPWAGTEKAHLSVVELLVHGNILGGVELISILDATVGTVIAWRIKTRPNSY